MKKAPLFTAEELAELREFDRMIDREGLPPAGIKNRLTKSDLSRLFSLFTENYSAGAESAVLNIPPSTVRYHFDKWRKTDEQHLTK